LENQVFKIHLKSRPDLIKKKPINYNYLSDIIEKKNKEILIAEENNEVIGFCIINIYEMKNHPIFFDMTNIEIEDFCVDENYRKKGVGRKLFEEVKLLAKNNNARFIELLVCEFNQNAKIFYEDMGMVIRENKMEYKI
jgi:ribosomal protein S18 acetylase RimI-like enzyme